MISFSSKHVNNFFLNLDILYTLILYCINFICIHFIYITLIYINFVCISFIYICFICITFIYISFYISSVYISFIYISFTKRDNCFSSISANGLFSNLIAVPKWKSFAFVCSFKSWMLSKFKPPPSKIFLLAELSII